MLKSKRFAYDEKSCDIAYINKRFYLRVFKDSNYDSVEKVVLLFPVKKYTDSQEETAFHVANILVLPYIDQVAFGEYE